MFYKLFAQAWLLLVGLAPASALLSQVGARAGVYTIPLRQEKAPIRRSGKVVSHRTAYSGAVHLGSPAPQEFRVIFDTGSAHLVVPAVECSSRLCLPRRRYNSTASSTGQAIRLGGLPVGPGEMTDRVTIRFGTGKVVGEMVREKVCLGPAAEPGPCIHASAVVATDMYGSSFEGLTFDGILGLGLSGLALSKAFSIFDVLVKSGQLAHPYFSVFLARDSNKASELAVGGHNDRHLLTPFSWVPMVKPELGYWLLEIASIRVNGKELKMCQDGTCSGILDSGTSHFGLPTSHFAEVDALLTRPVRSVSENCRQVDSPTVELQLSGMNLTLHAEDYMRPLPLSKDVMGSTARLPEADYYCRPKLLPVNWPPLMGPKVFILGEVVLQRYYTAYDWSGPRAGFALADQGQVRHHEPISAGSGLVGSWHSGDEIMLVQVTLSVNHRGCHRGLAIMPLHPTWTETDVFCADGTSWAASGSE